MQKKPDIEVDEYLRQTPIIPCFLISKDDGKIEINIDGFEKKKIPIETIKEKLFQSFISRRDRRIPNNCR